MWEKTCRDNQGGGRLIKLEDLLKALHTTLMLIMAILTGVGVVSVVLIVVLGICGLLP